MPQASDSESIVGASELATLKARFAATEAEVERLAALVERLCRELDVRP